MVPVTIKSSVFQYKNTNGEYVGVDAIADKTTAEQVAQVNSAISAKITEMASATATNISAIETKGQQTLASIPGDYTELSEDVENLKSTINFAEEEYEIIDNWYDGHYYKLNADPATIDVNNPSSSTNYACLYFAVEPGNIIEYRGKGSSAARIYALLSSKSDTGNVLSITSRYEFEDKLVFSIDNSDAKYIVFNADKRQPHMVCRIKNKHTFISGTDMNDVVNEGEYYCWNQTIRNTLEHVPDWVAGAFRMKVERLSPDTSGATLAIMQTIYTNTTSKENISISYRIARGNSPSTTFTDWMVLYNPNDVPFDVTNTTTIPENEDLDDYITTGTYCCRSAAISKTIENVPLFVDSSFLLWVINSRLASDENTYKRQILFANKYGTSSIYTRQLNTNGFGDWQLLVNSSSYESPMLLDASSFVPTQRLTGTVKKTIRVGTNNVAHYWLQGRIAGVNDYLADHPAKIAKWRNWLLKANVDILILQECEDWLDSEHSVSAFDTLYTSFFDEDTNIDPNPGESGLSSKARKKILNRLGLDTNTGDPESVTSDGETQYFTWVIVNISCDNDETIPVLLVNIHNFAYNKEAKRKDYLDTLATFIQSKNVQYFIIAGDTNVHQTSTDKSNMLSFCNSINATPVNGGIIGWFSTANIEEQGASYDNIIVSNNIRIDSIECDPVLVPSDTLHTDHTPVTATISFMETQE